MPLCVDEGPLEELVRVPPVDVPGRALRVDGRWAFEIIWSGRRPCRGEHGPHVQQGGHR
jgi:hypothetical protein